MIVVKSNFAKWKWKYNHRRVYFLPIEADPNDGQTYQLLSRSGRQMACIHDGKLTINKFYHFDGATYAPDFDNGLEWYGRHDAMCQLAEKYPEITRKMADAAFSPWLNDNPPFHLYFYYPAVVAYRKLKGLK